VQQSVLCSKDPQDSSSLWVISRKRAIQLSALLRKEPCKFRLFCEKRLERREKKKGQKSKKIRAKIRAKMEKIRAK